MPVISMFYGLIVRMYSFDIQQHQAPHIHVQYGRAACCDRDSRWKHSGRRSEDKQNEIVRAWIEIHQEELMADWQLAVEGQRVFTIDPLR